MTLPRLGRVLLLLFPLSLGGCSLLGVGGSLIGSVLTIAIYLIAIAAPIILSYYLYRHKL